MSGEEQLSYEGVPIPKGMSLARLIYKLAAILQNNEGKRIEIIANQGETLLFTVHHGGKP